MLRRLRLIPVPAGHPQGWLVAVCAIVTLISIFAAVSFDALWIALTPAAVLVLWLTLVDIRKVFFLMMGALPLSVEQNLPGGFATDLPSEQFMWLLMLVGIGWLLMNWRKVDFAFLKNPITLVLLAHLFWIIVTAITSQIFFISFKYLLAKGWYVIVFYFLASRFLKEEKDFKEFLWWFFVPLVYAVTTVVVRHAAKGFSFEEVGYVMWPHFRNHVMYACLLAVFLPYVWYGTYWYRRFSWQWLFLVLGILYFLFAINVAYTRAAYVALLAAVGIYWVVRWRLMKVALVMVALIFSLLIGFLSTRDNWLAFAPDYERTITHNRFDNLLEATVKLEDISTMERVYRWVAASYMIKEKPWMGYGPGNFYSHYKNYTVSSFKTYVSDNPERSGIHNYYLMVTVEQGLPGLLIFLLLCVVVMLRGESLFHSTTDPSRRRTLMAALLCFCLTNLLMLMNDFIETDKVGSLYFMSMAILANGGIVKSKQDESTMDAEF
ncbi:MAG: O-antigen ligase family protein [Saprospiraceae bacterium]|nr:O-antigen ligase family protein [Saprospiraceae bacterium]